jgi:hypothetical protein
MGKGDEVSWIPQNQKPGVIDYIYNHHNVYVGSSAETMAPVSAEKYTLIQATCWRRNTERIIELVAYNPANIQQTLTCSVRLNY